MKRTVILLIAAAIAAFAGTANAQTSGWNIGMSAGLNLFQGEDDANIGLYKDRYTISPVFTVGHWFTPSLGIQTSIWGGKLKGLGIGETPYAVREAPELVHAHNTIPDPWEEKFSYGMVQLEGTYNFVNALCGYSEDRAWSLIFHAGAEYARSFNSTMYCNSVGAVAGLTSSWKIVDRVNIFADYTLTVFGKKFDLVEYRGNVDDMMTLRVGLTINLGKKMKADANKVTVDTYTKARMVDETNRDNHSK